MFGDSMKILGNPQRLAKPGYHLMWTLHTRFYRAAYFRVVLSSVNYTFVTEIWLGGRRKGHFRRHSKLRHSASEISSLYTPRQYIHLSALV